MLIEASATQATSTRAIPPAIQAGSNRVPIRVIPAQMSLSTRPMTNNTTATTKASSRVPPYTYQKDDRS